jgi:FdhD protein
MEPLRDLPSTSNVKIHRVRSGPNSVESSAGIEIHDDVLAVEEPLEIRLEYSIVPKDGSFGTFRRERKSISITMRTPGYDFELAVGFLFTEGIVREAADIDAVKFCGPSRNVVRVDLKEYVKVDLKRLERHFYTSSSCGVCGKTSIEALRIQSQFAYNLNSPCFSARLIHELPAALRRSQGLAMRL